MVFQPMLPEVVGGTLSPRHVVNPIRQLCRHVSVYKGEATGIDLDKRTFYLDAGPFSHNVPVRFKHLLLTLGAHIDLSRVPGMSEHAFLIRNIGDALRLRSILINRCEEANLAVNPEIKKRLLTLVFVGGGYSGVETAGQVLDLVKSINRYYENISLHDYRVVLIHSRKRLLPTMSRKLADYAEYRLRKAGMEIVLNRRVQSITAHRVYLDDGSEIESNTVISTIGNAPHPLIRQLCKRYSIPNQQGWILATDTLQVPGHPYLWAAGDCAKIPLAQGGSCPPSAQFAMRQGKLAAHNIYKARDQKKLKSFTFKGLGELATIGHCKAVARIAGISLSGFFAWFLWRTIYLLKLPGLERKLRVMLDWTLDLFFSKDINLLNPERTPLLSLMHLEKGNYLYHKGEPPFSLYFVNRGCIDLYQNQHVVRSVREGDCLGERALLTQRPHIYTAIAREPTEITALEGVSFRALMKSSVEMKRMFRRAGTRYKTTEELADIKSRLPPEISRKTAAELMQSQLATLRGNMTLRETLPFLKQCRHSSYPVVDTEGKLKGVIHREDIFYFLKSAYTTWDDRIAQVDYTSLPTVAPSTSALKLIEKMLFEGVYKALVAHEDGRLCGIVTLLDLMEPYEKTGGRRVLDTAQS